MLDFLIKLADQHIKSKPVRTSVVGILSSKTGAPTVYDDVYDDNKVSLNYSYQYYLQR